MNSSLESQQEHLLSELRGIKRLRRGQISEQYLTKRGADGELKEYGPYFVWQYYEGKKKCSQRIPSDQVTQVQEDLQGYEHFKRLCEQLATVTQKMACGQQSEGKKNDRTRCAP